MGNRRHERRLGVHRCALWAPVLALALATGCDAGGRGGGADDGGASTRDGGLPFGDGGGPASDGSPDVSRDGGAVDAGPVRTDAGPSVPEDCDTPGDEDGDRLADCDDDECWATDACRAAELDEEGIAGWEPCGGPIELDADATTAVCEDGAPGSFLPPESELRCGRFPVTVVLEPYCEPDEGDGRALRIEGLADTTGEDEMIGPSTHRHVSFEMRLGEGQLYRTYAGGGSSGGEPYPLRQGWGAEGVAWIGWVTGLGAGTSLRILLRGSETESVFTILDDGGVGASYSDPEFYFVAGFDHSF